MGRRRLNPRDASPLAGCSPSPPAFPSCIQREYKSLPPARSEHTVSERGRDRKGWNLNVRVGVKRGGSREKKLKKKETRRSQRGRGRSDWRQRD